MSSSEVKIPEWYLADTQIPVATRYKSFQKYHQNNSRFLIQKIQACVKILGLPSNGETSTISLWKKTPQYLQTGDTDTDLRNLIYHHQKECTFLIQELRILVEKVVAK